LAILTNTTSLSIIINENLFDSVIPEIKTIQYNTGKGGRKKLAECEFLECKVYKLVRICTKAKIYEFVSNELRNATYTEVNK
ncbi:10777_t:CDS:2, partial [Cetraspora pellucida]